MVYTTKNRESAALMVQEVSELWKILILSDKCISKDISPEEFSSSLQLRKSGKAPGLDSIRPELILHVGATLKVLVKQILVFLHAPTQASSNLGERINGKYSEAEFIQKKFKQKEEELLRGAPGGSKDTA